MSTFFWILWSLAALVALVVIFFFLWGLMDQSVSSFNIGIWLLLLGVVAAVLLGSLALKAAGKLLAAKGILWILVAPGLLYLLFLLLILIGKPRWN